MTKKDIMNHIWHKLSAIGQAPTSFYNYEDFYKDMLELQKRLRKELETETVLKRIMTESQVKNEIALRDADYVSDLVKSVTGLNIFKNTRKIDYVEARSLFYIIMKHDYQATYVAIRDYMKSKGKSCDHSTVLHSVREYDIYKHYTPQLEEWREMILNKIVKERL